LGSPHNNRVNPWTICFAIPAVRACGPGMFTVPKAEPRYNRVPRLAWPGIAVMSHTP